jgi:hypothetical protein
VRKHLDVSGKKLARRQAKRGITTRYWTPAVQGAAFALPAYAETVVEAAIAEGEAEAERVRALAKAALKAAKAPASEDHD